MSLINIVTGKNNLYPGRVEATSGCISKLGLATKVFDLLSEHGMLAEGVKVEDILSCIEDIDGDGYLEVNLEKLNEKGLLKARSSLKADTDPINETAQVLQKDKLIVLFLPDPVETPLNPLPKSLGVLDDVSLIGDGEQFIDISEGSINSGELYEQGLRVFEKAIDASPLIGAAEIHDIPRDHDVNFAANVFRGKHGGSNFDMDAFQSDFNMYMSIFYVHIARTIQSAEDPHAGDNYGVEEQVTGETRTSHFSQATIKGERKARLDCDTFFQISYLLLSQMEGPDGNCPFDFVFLKTRDMASARSRATVSLSSRSAWRSNSRTPSTQVCSTTL